MFSPESLPARDPETPSAEEETLRVKTKLVEMYGWEGYQRVMAQIESDLARLELDFPAPIRRDAG
jgi:hypothetical protein